MSVSVCSAPIPTQMSNLSRGPLRVAWTGPSEKTNDLAAGVQYLMWLSRSAVIALVFYCTAFYRKRTAGKGKAEEV